ncbi:Transmembrane protein [Quillaja saponaria]|uniref:Transmembrane protein n=1 Tax=Quillaja saponaria TaxID=32244 RepID=A0AAD7P9R4_QUISA|nr:Transmembrane protein [Quillaja saponaria]KAJ7947668.1 Transmembrane protein [Quillaja saponaria]
MVSFSGLGIGLSLVFGCLLLAMVAELYYLICWKKRIANTETESEHSNYAKELFHLVCWKRNVSLHTANTQESVRRDPDSNFHEPDIELGSSKDLLLKTFGEEGVESELMRLHNLAGPPRFLFTIKEETKEDLESDDGKSRGDRSRKGSRTRSLSDIIVAIDTPFLTPIASSPLKSPLNPLDSYKHHGFNPLFESSGELEFNSFKSSPPPKFKFLRDAEEKLYRRLMEEAQTKAQKNSGSVLESGVKDPPNSTMKIEEKDGSFIRFIVKNKEKDLYNHLPQYPSSSSQVLPLPSSPTTLITPLDKAPIVH